MTDYLEAEERVKRAVRDLFPPDVVQNIAAIRRREADSYFPRKTLTGDPEHVEPNPD